MATELDSCRDRLISIARGIAAESRGLEGFDATSWVDRWLNEPLPALGTTRMSTSLRDAAARLLRVFCAGRSQVASARPGGYLSDSPIQ